MSKKYSLKDLADKLNVSERTARRYVDEYINEFNSIKSNKYRFNDLVFDTIVSAKSLDKDLTGIDSKINDDNLLTEVFTIEEYELFKKRLIEYPLLKEQIEYL